jgi:hypothetical protein
VRNLHKLKGKIIEPNSIVEVLAKLSPGHRWLGDKFPGYVFNIDRLARFDEIDLLVIYRDVRDVFRSSLQMAQTEWRGKKGYRGGQFHHNMAKPEFVATRWVEAIRIMQEHDERITQIRYEEIVASPEPILHEISDRLDVHPGKFLLSGIQTKSVGRYLGELDKDQIAIIEHIAGPTLERLGYDV